MKDLNITDKFMGGVNRLLSMQTPSGGFSYWPGQRAPTFWGTAYVTHLLLEGKKAGFPISQDRIDDALTFMERTLTNNPNQVDAKYGFSVAKSEPYMQYVLAKAGRGRKGRMRHLVEHPNSNEWGAMTQESLFMLKAGLYLSGDRTYADDLKAGFDGDISTDRRNGWAFWSDLRWRGVQLNLMEELFGMSAEAQPLAEAIANRLRGTNRSSHLNTQEISWTVSGLGQRMRHTGSSAKRLTLRVDGKTVRARPTKKGDRGTTWVVEGASGAKKIELIAEGLEDKTAYLLATVEGVNPAMPYQYGNKSLRVSRRYRNASGEELSLEDVELGALVHVELTIENLRSEIMRNVALVDRFGAGLEIENPRLGRDRAVGWISGLDLWDVDYMNIRDDRIELFGHLPPGRELTAVYTLRAVTAGQFVVPPVSAEAMYEPRWWSREAGDEMSVEGPWVDD